MKLSTYIFQYFTVQCPIRDHDIYDQNFKNMKKYLEYQKNTLKDQEQSNHL